MATPTQIKRKGRFSLILGTLLAAMLVASVAYADDISITNDVVVNGAGETKAPGETGTLFVYLEVATPDTQNGCNAPGSSPMVVSITSSDTGKVAIDSPGTVTLTGCGPTEAESIGYSVAGGASPGAVTITAAYSSGGRGQPDATNNPGSFTVTIAVTDATPPTTTITLAPSDPNGDNDWYTSAVHVQVSATDDTAVAETRCVLDPAAVPATFDDLPSPCPYTGAGASVSDDGMHTVYAAARDTAGNKEAVKSESFKIDSTTPTIVGAVVPASPGGDNGWYVTPPTVTFACSDATSGIFSCAADSTSPASNSETLGESASPQTVGGTATDNAGNTNTASVTGLMVDLSDPTVDSWTGSINEGDSFYFGSVPAAPTCTAADAISGPKSCVVTGYSTAVGTQTLTATAADNAGREGTETRTYTVLAWTLYGFYRPVDMSGSTKLWNTIKGGSTVPLKFNVFAGSTELTETAYVNLLQARQVSCSGGEEAPVEELSATGGTSLRYDWTAYQFIYNWQSPKQPGTCYEVKVGTLDGSSLTAHFRLK